MIALSNPVTGHQIKVDEESADFWRAAGYRDEPEKKAPAKRASSKPKKSDK